MRDMAPSSTHWLISLLVTSVSIFCPIPSWQNQVHASHAHSSLSHESAVPIYPATPISTILFPNSWAFGHHKSSLLYIQRTIYSSERENVTLFFIWLYIIFPIFFFSPRGMWARRQAHTQPWSSVAVSPSWKAPQLQNWFSWGFTVQNYREQKSEK